MLEYLIGFASGLGCGLLLMGIAWGGARRRVRELEALLDMKIGELLEYRGKR